MLTSLPPSSSYKPPPLSKRHSLSITTSHGPRPLHLVGGNVPSTAPPSNSTTSFPGSPLSNGDSKSISRAKAARRQSSISYYSSQDKDKSDNTTRPARPQSASLVSPSLSRNSSFGSNPRGSNSPRLRGDRRSLSASLTDAPALERPPLTLTEKHGELLQSIAQKEQLCLELRVQLAAHETELSQLKRRWELVVNRGFVPPTSAGPSGGIGSGGAVLEGIREGVQGVGKLLAAGLSMSDEPLVSTSPVVGSSRPRIAHSANTSNSSVSTIATTSSTTKSTRFSQSSFSSIGEEVESPKRQTMQEELLMVRDTGATPLMSPNVDFLRQQAEQKRKAAELLETETLPSNWGETKTTITPTTSKIHRRKSREVAGGDVSKLLRDPPTEDEEAFPEESPMEKAKRRSLNTSTFPPVSSIPGLGTLTTVAAASPVVSSWVGSVGKKWEELQRNPSFAKNQKRASVLFSDVSQSIASHVLGPGPLPPSSATSATSTPSLLDDDDAERISSVVLMPVSLANSPSLKPLIQAIQPTPVASPSIAPRVARSTSKSLDDDDTWNW